MGAIKNPNSKETKAKKKIGRPPKSQAFKNKICKYIAEGKTLRQIAKLKDGVSMETVNEWRRNDTAFAEQYARAKHIQCDSYADEINDLSLELFNKANEEIESPKFGTEAKPKKQGVTNATVQALRLLIDTRKWTASKLKPKVYGNSIKIESDSERTINVIIDTDDAKA